MNCLESAIASRFACLEKEVMLIFTEYWKIWVNNNAHSIGNLIQIPENRIEEKIEQFYGVHMDSIDNLSIKDAHKEIKKSILENDLPITVSIDGYFCHWNKTSYKKNDDLHIFNIVGFDEINQFYICQDSFNGTKLQYLPYNIFELSFNSIIIFSSFEERHHNYAQIFQNELLTFDSQSDKIDVRSAIYLISDIFENTFSITNEIQTNEFFFESELSKKLFSITRYRKKTSILLKYLSEKLFNYVIYSAAIDLEREASKWLYTRSILIKNFEKGEITLENIKMVSGIWRDIANSEYQIFKVLQKEQIH